MEYKDWGEGIPEYTENDLMTEEELLKFAMDIVANNEFVDNGYELVAWSTETEIFPNIVVKKDGQLIFIVVKCAVAPEKAALSNFWKNAYAQKAKNDYGAKCCFAAVNIGAEDPKRFNEGLALKHDAFLIGYNGLEELTGDIPITEEEIKQGLAEAEKMR